MYAPQWILFIIGWFVFQVFLGAMDENHRKLIKENPDAQRIILRRLIYCGVVSVVMIICVI